MVGRREAALWVGGWDPYTGPVGRIQSAERRGHGWWGVLIAAGREDPHCG